MSVRHYTRNEVKEFEAAHHARLQPRQMPTVPMMRAAPMVMIMPGPPITPEVPTIEANQAMRRALTEEEKRQREAEMKIRRESARLRKADERRRTASVQHAKAKAEKKRVSTIIIEDGKERRSVKKIITTCDKMAESGTLPKTLKQALDMFAIMVGDGHGAATEAGHDSSNRLTCGYEPMSSGSGFGSKTPSDRQLNGLRAWKSMKARMPAELMQTFLQIVGEEIGDLRVPRRTLAQIGEDNGFAYKMAAGAGAMEVRAVCSLIAHFIRDQSVTK